MNGVKTIQIASTTFALLQLFLCCFYIKLLLQVREPAKIFLVLLGKQNIPCHKFVRKLLNGGDGVDEKAVKAAFHPVAVVGFFDKAADVGDGVFASGQRFFVRISEIKFQNPGNDLIIVLKSILNSGQAEGGRKNWLIGIEVMFRHEAFCTVSYIEKGEKILRYGLMLQIHAVQVFRIFRRLVIVDHICEEVLFVKMQSK